MSTSLCAQPIPPNSYATREEFCCYVQDEIALAVVRGGDERSESPVAQHHGLAGLGVLDVDLLHELRSSIAVDAAAKGAVRIGAAGEEPPAGNPPGDVLLKLLLAPAPFSNPPG